MNLLLNPLGVIDRPRWWFGEVVSFALGFLGLVLLTVGHQRSGTTGLAGFLFILLCAWIHLAISAKRFRDHGFSGLWTLIWFLPWMGWLAQVIVCGIMQSEARRNARVALKYNSAPQAEPLPRLVGETRPDPNRPRPAHERLQRPATRPGSFA